MIRNANKFDIPSIEQLAKDFCEEYKCSVYENKKNWNPDYLKNQILCVLAGAGIALISENYDGVFIALKTPSFWIPHTYTLQEMIWYGKNKKVTLALLKEYLKIGKEMKQSGEIKEVYFSSYSESNFKKYGAKKLCNHWIL